MLQHVTDEMVLVTYLISRGAKQVEAKKVAQWILQFPESANRTSFDDLTASLEVIYTQQTGLTLL